MPLKKVTIEFLIETERSPELLKHQYETAVKESAKVQEQDVSLITVSIEYIKR